MLSFLISRAAQAGIVLCIVIVLAFCAVQMMPGDALLAAVEATGSVADARRLKASKDLAEGKLEDGVYTVVFRRKLAGGPGMHELVQGKTYNIGFAIHDDHADLRYHQVSLGYTLGIGAKADITAAKN